MPNWCIRVIWIRVYLEGVSLMSPFLYKKEERCRSTYKFSSFKKISILTILLVSLTLNNGFAKEDSQLNKIYHVYVGHEYMGAVSDTKAVLNIIEEKEEAASIQYNEFSLDASTNVKIIPEQVFSKETNDSETLAKLEKTVVAQTSAFALMVDNEPIAYLKDANDYEEVIRLLKLQYVSPQELANWNANQQSIDNLPTLQSGEARISHISFKQEVSGVTKKVAPNEIMTPEDAVKFLMTGSIEQDQYLVQSGDVLGSIAKAHNLTTAELLALNPEITVDTVLQIGQALNVTIAKPFVTIEVKQEKKITDTIPFEKVVEEDPTMPKGESVTKQQGVEGKKETTYLVTSENGTRTSKIALEEKVIQEPIQQIEIVGTKVIPSRGSGEFTWPAVGGYISSNMGQRWGAQHRGIDIARPSNYNILASDNGVVVAAGISGTYGNRIVINHNNGYTTLYAHLSSINVEVGQVVEKGSVIGIMGSTGNSTGTHLHFELEKNGELLNPLSYVSK